MEILDLVKKNYSIALGSIISAEPAPGYSINSSNLVLSLSSGKKALCKLIPNETASKISPLLSIVDYCSSKGAKIQKVYQTDSSRLAIDSDSGVVYVTSYFEGGHFNGSDSELSDFAKELAIFHKIIKDCPHEYDSGFPPDGYRLLDSVEYEKILSSALKKKTDFDSYAAEVLPFLHDVTNQNIRNFKSLDPGPVQMIHGDLHTANVVFNNAKTAAILDLNSVWKGELARDVAFACCRFAMSETGDPNLIMRRWRLFLDSYKKESPGADFNDSLIRYYYINESLRRASYILRNHYFNGDTKWSFDLKKHIKNIEIIMRCNE
jgi:hypothetical protein